MTEVEFAQKIKTKYPEYSTVPDQELAQKMLTKYPQYKSEINTPIQPKQDKNLLDYAIDAGTALTNFIGAKPIADAYAAEYNYRTLPEGQKQFVEYPSVKETIGAGLQTGSLLIPGGQATLAGRVATGAAAGYAFDVGSKLQEGQSVQSSLTPGVGTAVGGALPLAGKAASMLNNATKNLPERIIQSALGQSKPELMAGKDVSSYLLKKRSMGTTSQLLDEAQGNIERLSTQIADNLANKASKTTRLLKNEVLMDTVARMNKEGASVNSLEVREIVDRMAPQARAFLEKESLSLVEANQLRQLVDKTLGARAFLNAQLPYNKEILKSFNNALREKVKELAPEGTRSAFEELSKEITLRNALLNKSAQQAKNQVVNAFDIIIAGGGLLGGGPMGAFGTYAAKKTFESTIGKTFLAMNIRLGQDVIDKLAPILEKLTPVERTVILNALSSVEESRQ